jgi:hypothetical protein
VTLPVKSPSLKVQPIYPRHRVVLMVSPKNPLAKLKTVPVGEGGRQPAAAVPQDRPFTRQAAGQVLFRPHVTRICSIRHGTAEHHDDQALRGR